MRALENEQTRRRMLGYSPRYDANIGLWVCADNCVEFGGLVSQLNDMSGYGRHFTQSVDSYKPTLIRNARNGHAGIQADGVNDYLLLPAATGLVQPLHHFFALSWTYVSSKIQNILDGTTNNGASIFQPAGAQKIGSCFGGTYPSPLTLPSGYFILDVVENNASSKMAINGGTQSAGGSGTVNPGGLVLFGNSALGCNCAATLLEYTAFTAELTSTARLQELARLSTKWAIPLAA